MVHNTLISIVISVIDFSFLLYVFIYFHFSFTPFLPCSSLPLVLLSLVKCAGDLIHLLALLNFSIFFSFYYLTY